MLRARRTKRFGAAVAMLQHLGMDHAAIEPALHRDGFVLGDDVGVFTARTEIDQRATTGIGDDNLLPKILRPSLSPQPGCRVPGC